LTPKLQELFSLENSLIPEQLFGPLFFFLFDFGFISFVFFDKIAQSGIYSQRHKGWIPREEKNKSRGSSESENENIQGPLVCSLLQQTLLFLFKRGNCFSLSFSINSNENIFQQPKKTKNSQKRNLLAKFVWSIATLILWMTRKARRKRVERPSRLFCGEIQN